MLQLATANEAHPWSLAILQRAGQAKAPALAAQPSAIRPTNQRGGLLQLFLDFCVGPLLSQTLNDRLNSRADLLQCPLGFLNLFAGAQDQVEFFPERRGDAPERGGILWARWLASFSASFALVMRLRPFVTVWDS